MQRGALASKSIPRSRATAAESAGIVNHGCFHNFFRKKSGIDTSSHRSIIFSQYTHECEPKADALIERLCANRRADGTGKASLGRGGHRRPQ